LVEGVERHLDEIRSSTSILVIPPTPEGIQEFRDLENKYSDLCPLSGDKLVESLKSYSSPLLYFSQDPETYKIRGIYCCWSGRLVVGRITVEQRSNSR